MCMSSFKSYKARPHLPTILPEKQRAPKPRCGPSPSAAPPTTPAALLALAAWVLY